MPGVAQLWLTQEELDALLRAAGSTNTRVNDRIWANLAPKLKEARDGLGCPVNAGSRLAGEALRHSDHLKGVSCEEVAERARSAEQARRERKPGR